MPRPQGFAPAARARDPRFPSKRSPVADVLRNLALEILSVLGACEIVAILHLNLAAENGRLRPSEDVVAFPGRIVGLVQIGRAHLTAPARIENGDIGVAA